MMKSFCAFVLSCVVFECQWVHAVRASLEATSTSLTDSLHENHAVVGSE